jgi:signal transduction histidine kinase
MSDATARVRSILPKGTLLTEESFRSRHRVIVAIAALHVPVLGFLAVVRGLELPPVLLGLGIIVGLTALAHAPLGRLPRMLAATGALAGCSALLVHATGGLVAAHLHFFFALGLVALYQDWRPYLAAIAGVGVHHVLAVAFLQGWMAAQTPDGIEPLSWALLHGGFVLAVGVTHLTFWKVTEAEQQRSRELWHQLYEGERALVQQLQGAEAVKTELLSVVSHEFRTPLTSILGFSHTLMARADQLDPATIRLCVGNIDQQSRRLARLVHNVLAASGDVAPDPSARVDLAACAHEAAREVRDAYRDAPVIEVDAAPGLRGRIDRDVAHRILVNLVENAVKFGAYEAPVEVRLRADGPRALIEVTNVASPIAATQLDRMFQPFVQEDSSDSRTADGIGLGLHVVRRLLEAYGGTIAVEHEGEQIVFSATVPRMSSFDLAIDLREDAANTPPRSG